MVRVLSSNLVDHGIAPGSGQTITLVFVASSLNMHSRDRLTHNQYDKVYYGGAICDCCLGKLAV